MGTGLRVSTKLILLIRGRIGHDPTLRFTGRVCRVVERGTSQEMKLKLSLSLRLHVSEAVGATGTELFSLLKSFD